MKSITSYLHANMQSYWHRRTYQRLERSSPSSKKRAIRLGGRRRRKTRLLWKLHRVQPMLGMRHKISWLVKLLGRLRSGYVDAMLMLAGGEVMRPSAAMKRGEGVAALGRSARCASAGRGEFERRRMLHVSNSVLASRELTSLILLLCLKGKRKPTHAFIGKA